MTFQIEAGHYVSKKTWRDLIHIKSWWTLNHEERVTYQNKIQTEWSNAKAIQLLVNIIQQMTPS